jgi:hypothetical protein
MAGRGSKPGEHRGGRRRGTPNKLTADLKSMIEGALHSVGGQHYLEAVAIQDPAVFCGLITKLIPKDLRVSVPVEQDPQDVREMVKRLAYEFRKEEAQLQKEARAAGKGEGPQ